MDVSSANLESMTEPELRELIRAADEALKRRVAERARSTLKEIPDGWPPKSASR